MPFPITCAACHKTFSIADDVYERKVKGRVVTIKCKQCQAGIRVDGTKDTPVFSMAGDSVRPPPAAAAAPTPAVAAPAPAVAAPAPAVAAAAPAAVPEPSPAPTTKEQPKPSAATGAPKAAPTAVAPKAALATATPKAAAPAASTTAAKTTAVAATPKATATAARAQPAASAAAAKPPAATGKTLLGIKAPVVAAAAKAATPAPTQKAAQPATAAASTAASETLWAVDYPDGEDRELTLLEIEKELARGVINPTTLVWREGMAEWLELGQVPELRSLTAPPKPPPAALPPQRAKAASAPVLPEQRAKAASAPGLPELSATLPQPTLPQAAAPQRPPAPSSPAMDFGLRDALKTPTPAPAPLAKPPPTFATSVDARAPAPQGTFAQPIAALTPPAFPASPLPLTAAPFQTAPAAAPPFGRPSPTPFGAVAPIADVPEWPKKSRTPLIIGAVAVAAVGVLIFILTRSSANEVPPPAPISALPAAAPTTPSAPRAAEPASATDTARPDEQNPGSSAAMEPPGSAPMATPNAGFAELFASGARSADEKHGVTGPTQRFDAKAAKAALASAATQTPQCREKGGPAGKATVVVTFEASGKVSSATVSDPPFAGTSSGACIAAALKRATVPAFSGLPGTVTKIISIQ